jgi:hypothetical protein
MSWKIIGVEVVASYDAMTRKPGMIRPLPAAVSARVAEKLTEATKMQEVLADALSLPPIGGELSPALFNAKQRVVGFMNSRRPPSPVPTPEFAVDATATEYRPTSTGGHETITWITQVDSSGAVTYWETDVEIQGERIHAHASLVISVKEVPTAPVMP